MCVTCRRQGGRCDRTDSIGRPRDRSPAGRRRGRSRRGGRARAGQGVRAQPGHRLAAAQDVAGARLVTVDEAPAGTHSGVTAVELGGAAGPDAVIAAAHPVLERTCAADRRDGVAGDARRRWAHLRRRGHPDRGADGELAGPHRAVARHVDGQGAARVPAARASCAGCCPRRSRRSPTPRSPRPGRSPPSSPPPGPAATARARASWSRRSTACRHRCSTAPAARWRCSASGGPKDRVPEQRSRELGPIAVEAAREVGTRDPVSAAEVKASPGTGESP